MMKTKTESFSVTRSTEPATLLNHFLTRASSRTLLCYLAFGLVVIIGILVAGREMEHYIKGIEAWIQKQGPWGIVAFTGIFVVAASCLFPDTVLCIIAGALFGLGWGAAAVAAGNTLGAITQYWLSRKLLKNNIEKILTKRPSLSAIQHAIHTNEFRLQILLRLTPLNHATISYLLGATGVRFSGFLMASLAAIPDLFIKVYFGHAGKHVAHLSSQNRAANHLDDVFFFAGLAVCVIVIFIVSRMARKALDAVVNKSSAADGSSQFSLK
jgi:uncharacterized membrane protein YdjX (TVP38/TMEM64 family)